MELFQKGNPSAAWILAQEQIVSIRLLEIMNMAGRSLAPILMLLRSDQQKKYWHQTFILKTSNSGNKIFLLLFLKELLNQMNCLILLFAILRFIHL